MGSIICFANNKGGVGKSTTVATLGQIWASQGKKVLFVDLDSQANLTSMLNCPIPSPDEPCTFGMLVGDICDPVKLSENADIIPSNLALSKIEVKLAGEDGREFKLLDAIDSMKEKYDYILIDCPPALGLMTVNALVASDFVVMPSTADEYGYLGLGMVAELAGRIHCSARMNPNLEILGIIITRYKGAFKVHAQYRKTIQQDVGELLVECPVRDRTSVLKAAAMHQSLLDYDPSGEVTQDYVKVADILEKRIEAKRK